MHKLIRLKQLLRSASLKTTRQLILFRNSLAGILIVKPFEEVTREDMLENFEVNVVTPSLLSQKLLPLLKLSGSQNKARTLIANVSSKIASIDDNKSGGRYPYR